MKTGFRIGLCGVFVLLLAGIPVAASAQDAGRCGNAAEVARLPDFQRDLVAQVLEAERHARCREDDCEFQVERVAGDRYLVKMRARRFVPADASCVTVWMSEQGFVFDAKGKTVDIWPYCVLMSHEAALAQPDFTPDPLPYKKCRAPGTDG